MRFMITGGLGFIGSRIAKRLISEGHDVFIIDNMLTSLIDDIDGSEKYNIDLMKIDNASKFSISSIDYFMHLAGPSSGMASAKDPVGTIHKGYQLAYNALQIASQLNAKRFLFASSMTVYGNVLPEQNPVTEKIPCKPLSHYAIGKFSIERLVDTFCSEKNIGFNNIRMFNVYGPGQDLSRMDQGLVSIFLSLLMKNPKITSKGSLERFRDIVHINDVVKAWIKCAIDNDINGDFNLGSGISITIGEVINFLAEALSLNDKLSINVEKGSPGDIFGISADISSLKNATGFTPDFPPEKGIRHFVEWAKSQK